MKKGIKLVFHLGVAHQGGWQESHQYNTKVGINKFNYYASCWPILAVGTESGQMVVHFRLS